MPRITLEPSGHRFDCEAGETVLAAALREGLVLPYGCRSGSCGTCKATVRSGAFEHGPHQARALTDAERARGRALLCQVVPKTDLVVQARPVPAAGGIVVRTLPCRVQAMRRVTEDVMILELKLPANERFRFLAGQYVDVLLRDGSRRSFSMANAPDGEASLELHVRHVPGGQFTDHVFSRMKERDILRFEGPFGTFFLREDSDKPCVLVASGTGFAPIKSILLDAFAKGVERPMTLYWGGRRPRDLYQDELPRRWAAERPHRFRYVPVVSDALAEDGWCGRTGFVHRAVMEDLPDLSGYQVYACGVPAMVEAARRDFTAHCGLPEEEFHCDSFSTQADLAAEARALPAS